MGVKEEKVALLRNVSIFAGCSDKVLNRMAGALRLFKVEPGQLVIEKGELGDCMYILAAGKVRVHDGPHTLAEIGPGKIFGELALLDTEPRSASVSAIAQSQLYKLEQESFFRVLAEEPDVSRAILKMLVQRMREQNAAIVAEYQQREKELTRLVDERTRELQEANDRLQKTYDEIRIQNLNLAAAKETIHEQLTVITQKNEDITASIQYAKRIQNAILPAQIELDLMFPHNFVLYMPKDIVSGDFYWAARDRNVRSVAAVDCTGHGVPGAFMSVMGYSSLNQIITRTHLSKVGQILNQLDSNIRDSLRQSGQEGQSRDGMDLALCSVVGGYTLHYAGANNPLYLYRANGEFIEIKADKRPIGGGQYVLEDFTRHTIPLSPGDTFYIFSDGFADQFGGPRGKKYSYKKMRELMTEILPLEMTEQRVRLHEAFEEWRGDEEQMDDVLVMGIRV